MSDICFSQLPRALKEHLLWEMELEYDSYESSKAECIHGILNESYDLDRNENNIKNFMLGLSKDTLERYTCNVLADLRNDVDQTMSFLTKSVYGR